MPGIGLRAIDKRFILGLGDIANDAASGAISSSAKIRASAGAQVDAASVEVSLRSGAQIYAQSVQNLNNVGSVLNLVKADLEELLEVTDKLITLAERSSKISTSDSTRRRLDREFDKLATDFKEIVENAVVDDEEILTKEGLSALFSLVGLNEESSDSIAEFLGSFVLPDEEDVFASEQIEGPAVVIPAAVQPGDPESAFVIEQISRDSSGSTISEAYISRFTNVYQDDENSLGQNPNELEAPVFVTETGNMASIPYTELTNNVEVMAMVESLGYTVVKSDEDFLGFNSAGVDQLYLMNNAGEIIHQYTDFSSSVSLHNVAVANQGTKVIFASNEDLVGSNADNTDEIYMVHVSTSFGQAPLSADLTQETSYVSVNISEVFMARNGNMMVYHTTRFSPALDEIVMHRIPTGQTKTSNSGNTIIGMTGNFDMAIVDTSGDVFEFTWSNPNETLVYEAGLSATNFTSSQQEYIGFKDGNDIKLVDISGGFTTSSTTAYTLDAGDTVDKLMVVHDGVLGSVPVDVGILGTLNKFDSSRAQLYRIRERAKDTAANQLKTPTEVDKIFDGTIGDRANAIVALNDLEALKEQIESNLDVVDEGTEILQANLDLVRAAGLAMLDLSEQGISEQEAENIANVLRREIRKLAPADAISIAAENLEPIAVATLVGLQNLDEN